MRGYTWKSTSYSRGGEHGQHIQHGETETHFLHENLFNPTIETETFIYLFIYLVFR